MRNIKTRKELSLYRKLLNNRKGVAGLDLFLQVIATLFMIGLLIMIFSLIGGELKNTDAVKYDNTSFHAINDTTHSLADAVDWFDIIVVLTAVTVLILLAVIIMRAVRGGGFMGGGGA